MTDSERRSDHRVPMDLFLNEYVKERPYRALAMNLSEAGLTLQKLAEPIARWARTIALEFELPGTGEVIWAKGESRFESIGDDFHLTGVRLVAMATKHQRLVRDYVYDKRRWRMDSLLLRYRESRLAVPDRRARRRPSAAASSYPAFR